MGDPKNIAHMESIVLSIIIKVTPQGDSDGNGKCHLCLVLGLLLGLFAWGRWGTLLCLVDDQAGPALILVPFEAGQVGIVELVVRLAGSCYSSWFLTGEGN